MPLPFDPHPWGCPIGLRATPAEMPETLTAVCLKLRDLMHGSIFVINPSRGTEYPILSLYADAGARRPRVVWFPAWEDNRQSRKRRIRFDRQTTLLQRLTEAQVAGESLEEFRGRPSDCQGPRPLMLPLAASAHQMDTVIRDLYDAVGDVLRVTVTTVPQVDAHDLQVVRVYSLADEHEPRMVLFPGWAGELESRATELDRARMEEVMGTLGAMRIPEVPVEAFFG